MPEVELEVNPCALCHKPLKGPGGINATGDPSLVLFMSAVTRGLRPRLKTRAVPKVFCYGCGTSLALGIPPTEKGDLYVTAWELFRDLIGGDESNSIVLAAVTQMRHPRARLRRMPGSIAPKQLPAAV